MQRPRQAIGANPSTILIRTSTRRPGRGCQVSAEDFTTPADARHCPRQPKRLPAAPPPIRSPELVRCRAPPADQWRRLKPLADGCAQITAVRLGPTGRRQLRLRRVINRRSRICGESHRHPRRIRYPLEHQYPTPSETTRPFAAEKRPSTTPVRRWRRAARRAVECHIHHHTTGQRRSPRPASVLTPDARRSAMTAHAVSTVIRAGPSGDRVRHGRQHARQHARRRPSSSSRPSALPRCCRSSEIRILAGYI